MGTDIAACGQSILGTALNRATTSITGQGKGVPPSTPGGRQDKVTSKGPSKSPTKTLPVCGTSKRAERDCRPN